MQAHPLQYALGLSLGLLGAGCEAGSSESETTAPEISDVPATPSYVAGARTFHFKSKGPFGRVFFFGEEANGVHFGELEVSRSGVNRDQQTFLFYSLQRCDPVLGECVLLEQGSGLIPNGDLRARHRTMSLHTNTSEAANSAFERTAGSGGTISLQWTRTTAFVDNFHLHSRTRIEGVIVFHSQFAGTSSSAIAEGTVLGVGVDGGTSSAIMGTVRTGTLIIEKGP